MTSHLEWVKRLARAQAEKSGIVGLGRMLMERLRKSVIVTDEQGRVLSWHVIPKQPIPPQEKIYLPVHVVSGEGIVKGSLNIGGQKYGFYCRSVSNHQKMGYIWILSDKDSLSSTELDEIEYLASALLVEMAKKQEQGELLQYLRDEILLNMVFNNPAQAGGLGKLWGWNLSLTYIVMIIEGKMKEHGHGFLEVRILAEDLLATRYPGIVTGMIGNCLVAMFPLQKQMRVKESQPGAWKGIALEAYEVLQEELSQVKLNVGVGTVYENPPSIHRSYQEAKVALEIGRFLGKGERLTFFDELGAIRLFYNQREQDLKDFFTEVLGVVLKYDQQHEGSLLLTLWYYFIAQGDISKAAESLYVHVNTMRYRMRKVEELVGGSLDDQELRFNVYAALKVGIMLEIIDLSGNSPDKGRSGN
jgi:sugar diacid utilization regulator